MNEVRQGEIALQLIKLKLRKGGLPSEDFQRNLGNVAKETGIDYEELREFYESILPEILRRILGRKSISLTTSD